MSTEIMAMTTKPKLLVLELWGLGDLAIATPFLQAASEKFAVTILAKPYARDLANHFWPEVKVVPFVAPWTAFRRKYAVWNWPWGKLLGLLKLRKERFEAGVSVRWDPRDHVLLYLLGSGKRIGFPRLASQVLLTQALPPPSIKAHRYEYWLALGAALQLEMPKREQLASRPKAVSDIIVIHSGAGQQVRVWPLERYRAMVQRLRALNYTIVVACDAGQQSWWRKAGEENLAMPGSVSELITLLERSAAFIGNDSGPGHLAAILGVPTFTVFGPQLSEWFAPLHPAAQWVDGSPCPYKPCSDYCRFSSPKCLLELQESAVIAQAVEFVGKVVKKSTPSNSPV